MYSRPKEIRNLMIKNRFIRSATYEWRATEDGSVTDELIQFYKKIALGGVGLIITGYAYIQKIGQSFPNQIAIDKDDSIDGLSRLADAIHKFGLKENDQLSLWARVIGGK